MAVSSPQYELSLSLRALTCVAGDLHIASRKSSYSVVHLAVKSGDITVLHYVLALGCDVNARDKKGRTPLMLAARLDRFYAITYLLNFTEADKNAQDNFGRTVRSLLRLITMNHAYLRLPHAHLLHIGNALGSDPGRQGLRRRAPRVQPRRHTLRRSRSLIPLPLAFYARPVSSIPQWVSMVNSLESRDGATLGSGVETRGVGLRLPLPVALRRVTLLQA